MSRFSSLRAPLTAALLLLTACGRREPARETTLRDLPQEQLRMTLKGYPGDWRDDAPMARGEPEPARTPALPAGAEIIPLPPRSTPAAPSVTDAIANRRSLRAFSPAPLALADAGHLLWCAQGESGTLAGPDGLATPLRTAPSGGARYPLELWLLARNVTGLAPGVYRYQPHGHALAAIHESAEALPALLEACYGDPTVGTAPAVLVWTAVPARTEWKYAYLAHRMIAMEAGHSAQNVYLGGAAVGVGACAVLGYNQTRLDALLGVDGREEFALYVMPVGRPAGDTP